MEKCEVGRKSARTVPVIIENHENHTKKTKLMVPSNYTAGHLVNVLRSRLHLLPYHSVYLFLKSKQSPILMSKSIGHLYRKHRDDKGLLRLIHAEQESFGFRGNIRAIRFRQKWMENHHNNAASADSGMPQSLYSGAPPPYFPMEPPSISNFGSALDIDDPSDLVANQDDYYYEYMASTFMLEMEDTVSEPSPNSNPNPWQSPSYPVEYWENSGLSNPFLSPSATNSTTSHPYVVIDSEGQVQEHNLGEEQAQNIISTAATIDLNPSVPDFSVNNQPVTVQNPQGPLPLLFYESDSDFYDSDKDVDMEN